MSTHELELARLYFAVKPGEPVIRKGNVTRKRMVRPDGKTFFLRLKDGCRFEVKG